jgi:hypothetical protein
MGKNYTYYLNKLQRTNYTNSNHLTNGGKEKMEEHKLIKTKDRNMNQVVNELRK